MNIETMRVKYDDRATKCLDTERMCWVDCGRDDRIYLYATRIYYVVGKPAFEVVGKICFADVYDSLFRYFIIPKSFSQDIRKERRVI